MVKWDKKNHLRTKSGAKLFGRAHAIFHHKDAKILSRWHLEWNNNNNHKQRGVDGVEASAMAIMEQNEMRDKTNVRFACQVKS